MTSSVRFPLSHPLVGACISRPCGRRWLYVAESLGRIEATSGIRETALETGFEEPYSTSEKFV